MFVCASVSIFEQFAPLIGTSWGRRVSKLSKNVVFEDQQKNDKQILPYATQTVFG